MRLRVYALALVFVFAVTGPAQAYLDPGSISIVIQAIAAALAGAALTWKYWYWRFLNLLGLRKKREDVLSSRSAAAEPSDHSER